MCELHINVILNDSENKLSETKPLFTDSGEKNTITNKMATSDNLYHEVNITNITGMVIYRKSGTTTSSEYYLSVLVSFLSHFKITASIISAKSVFAFRIWSKVKEKREKLVISTSLSVNLRQLMTCLKIPRHLSNNTNKHFWNSFHG